MTVVSAKSFPDGASLPLVADIQYREPYSSAAFNRKLRGILGMGLYKGLYPMPGSGLNLLISSQDSGDTSGTASFDIGDDYQITVRQQADITIAMTAGTSKIVALQCVFGLGIETYQVNSDSTVQAAEIVLLDAGTTLGSNQLELGVVTIPTDATQITTDMIDVSGRILQTVGIELSSAIDSTSETVAANSYAIKRALDYVAGKFALLGSNADITSMSALSSISSSALNIAGALTLGSTLSVASATAFSDAVTVGGKLTAMGATTLASTLGVTGATTLGSTLSVGGDASYSSTLTMNYRGIIARDAAIPYLSFRRQDVQSAPTVDTEIGRVVFGYGLTSTDSWGTGQLLSYLRAVAYALGGGEISINAHNAAGTLTSSLALNGYTGLAYLAGGLVAKSTLSLSGAAALSSDLTVGGDVTVTGDSTLIGDVTITGTLTNDALYGRLIKALRFTASGTYTPTAGTKAILVEVLGAGGGGGGARATDSAYQAGGAGGGSGAYARSYLTSGFSGVTVTIGAGGSGGANTASGSAGGTTSFGSLITCTGGGGGGGTGSTQYASGSSIQQNTGGSGGTPSGGNICNGMGRRGGTMLLHTVGNNVGGDGAASIFAGGGNGAAGSNGNGGAAALGSGGGGAISGSSPSTAYTGGSGGDGMVIIHEFG